jgi:hypothetical protein
MLKTVYCLKQHGKTVKASTLQMVWQYTLARFGNIDAKTFAARGYSIEPKGAGA